MNYISRFVLATMLFSFTAALLLCGCKSREELLIEKLHSPFDIDHQEAIFRFGEMGVPALEVLMEEMKDPELRLDIRKICEEIGPEAIIPLIDIIHQDTAVTPFPYSAEDMFLNAPQDGILFGDNAGLIRAGTATECLWSTVEDEADVNRVMDLYLAEPKLPEREYMYLVLRDLHEKAWNAMAERVKKGISPEKSHQLIVYLTTGGVQAVDALSGDVPPEGLEALLAYSDVPTRTFYLNGMAYEHNDVLIPDAMEQFKKEAKENPDDPIPPMCVGALMMIQTMGVDKHRIAERWLDKSREAYFKNEKTLGWTTFEKTLFLEHMAHYYGGILQWYAVTMQDLDMVDFLADRQRVMLHPAEDLRDSVKPNVRIAKESGANDNTPE